MEVLLEELYVDEAVQELLGKTPNKLRGRDYPQAVAVALILRHSWRADNLASILERLGIPDQRPLETSTHIACFTVAEPTASPCRDAA